MNEATAAHSVHVNQLRRWRQQAIDELPTLFSQEQPVNQAEMKEKEQEIHNLYAEIGRLTTELTWLKKKLATELSVVERRALVEWTSPPLSISRLAASVTDAALAYALIAGPDPHDPISQQ